MQDLISRQAAIKEAESWVGLNGYEQHLQRDVVEWLKELPSAQPEVRTQMSSADCISRQAAIDVASGYCHLANVADELRKLPSAQLEPQWISCSERLPEEDPTFYVAPDERTSRFVNATVIGMTHPHSLRRTLIARYSYTANRWVIRSSNIGNVIAWMPLPEPWRGET